MKRFVPLTLIGVVVMCFCCDAQQRTAMHTVTINILPSSSIRLKPDTRVDANLQLDNIQEMEDGMTADQAAIYQVQSNSPWVVHVSASDETWKYEGNHEDPFMPLNTLYFKTSNSPGFNEMSTTSQTVARGDAGDFGGENEFSIDYKVRPGLEFPSGTYQAEVAYTISTP